MKVEEWLGNKLSIDIFNKKYKNDDETLDEFFERVTNNNPALISLIKDKKFIFGGRILANRGVENRKLTYSNCYVLAPPDDNLESIFKCASDMARTFSYGGKTTTLPPYIVMCSKKFSEPVNAGCVLIIC